MLDICTVLYLYNLYIHIRNIFLSLNAITIQIPIYVQDVNRLFEGLDDDSKNMFPWYGMYRYISARQINIDRHIRYT